MQHSKTMALVGAGMLFLGAFMPILSLPVAGSVNYFQNGRGDGVIIVLLALATIILAATGRTRHVLWTGAAALLTVGYTFVRIQSALSDLRARLDTDLADNPFRGLAEAAMGSIQMQWGWAVLVLGAGMTVYAGWQAQGAGRG